MLILFPYRMSEPIRRQPLATVALILINLVVYGVCVFGPWDTDEILTQWGYIPNDVAVLTIPASMFLHAGVFHLLFNMWFLYLLGPLLESRLGHIPFLLLYLGGGLAAAGISGAFSIGPARIFPHVGASGAIAALMGALVVLYPFADLKIWYFFFFGFRAGTGTFSLFGLALLGLWFLKEMLLVWLGADSGGTAPVDRLAHVGGFVFGAVGCILAFGKEGLRREVNYD